MSSLKEDEVKLIAELEEKQSTLTTLTEDMEALKIKQERASMQVCGVHYVHLKNTDFYSCYNTILYVEKFYFHDWLCNYTAFTLSYIGP